MINFEIDALDRMGYKGAADTLENFQYDIMNYMQERILQQTHYTA
jgi:hypothetical protein